MEYPGVYQVSGVILLLKLSIGDILDFKP